VLQAGVWKFRCIFCGGHAEQAVEIEAALDPESSEYFAEEMALGAAEDLLCGGAHYAVAGDELELGSPTPLMNTPQETLNPPNLVPTTVVPKYKPRDIFNILLSAKRFNEDSGSGVFPGALLDGKEFPTTNSLKLPPAGGTFLYDKRYPGPLRNGTLAVSFPGRTRASRCYTAEDNAEYELWCINGQSSVVSGEATPNRLAAIRYYLSPRNRIGSGMDESPCVLVAYRKSLDEVGAKKRKKKGKGAEDEGEFDGSPEENSRSIVRKDSAHSENGDDGHDSGRSEDGTVEGTDSSTDDGGDDEKYDSGLSLPAGLDIGTLLITKEEERVVFRSEAGGTSDSGTNDSGTDPFDVRSSCCRPTSGSVYSQNIDRLEPDIDRLRYNDCKKSGLCDDDGSSDVSSLSSSIPGRCSDASKRHVSLADIDIEVKFKLYLEAQAYLNVLDLRRILTKSVHQDQVPDTQQCNRVLYRMEAAGVLKMRQPTGKSPSRKPLWSLIA
jgi:hypothetical protein